ncbi:MAG: acyl carrier protein [Thermoanaerobaculia bacterium]
MSEGLSQTQVRERIKRVLVERLKLERPIESIGDDEQLFGDGLGLDSIDALELVLGLEQEFDVKIEDEEVGRSAMASVATLADFVLAKRSSAVS